MPLDVHFRFDWEGIEHEQGNYELNMKVFLWFKPDVSMWERKRSLADRPLAVRVYNVRVILEISLDKGPWSRAQAIVLEAMVLGATTFDTLGKVGAGRISKDRRSDASRRGVRSHVQVAHDKDSRLNQGRWLDAGMQEVQGHEGT